LKNILIGINGNVYGKNVVGNHSKMTTADYTGGEVIDET
jgi:hypothetical protein